MENEIKQGQSVASKEKRNLAIFLAAAALIIVLTVYFRIPMLQYYGFYEPDGYFHYSLIRAAVSNNFAIPQVNPLSGWPPSCNGFIAASNDMCGPQGAPHHETFGLYWITLIPYFFLRFVGIGYYDIMRLVPVLFGIFDVLLAYFLARNWSKDRFFGLLVMALIALNMGNAARTSALIYRGDTFITAFFLAALITTIAIFKTENTKKKLAYSGATAILLSLCNLVWSGAAFTTTIYILSLMSILIFGFALEKKKLVEDSKYMLIVLLVWFFIVALYRIPSWIVSGQALTDNYFFVLFVPLALAWYFVHYMLSKHEAHLSFFDTPYKRFGISVAALVAAFVLLYILLPGFVSQVTGGYVITSSFSSTIQELQPPTYDFLFASFNFQNFTNPMSLVMVIATYFKPLTLLFWFVLLAMFLPYFFMRVEHGEGGVLGGHAKWKFDFDETVLILIAYFAITSYLQMNAIRFNSLISIPLSIFSAFTIYWIVLFLKNHKPTYDKQYLSALVATSFMYLIILIPALLQGTLQWYLALLYIAGIFPVSVFFASMINQLFAAVNNRKLIYFIPVVVVIGVLISFFIAQLDVLVPLTAIIVSLPAAWLMARALSNYSDGQNLTQALYVAAVLFLVALLIITDIGYISGLAPADQINTQFVQALAWAKNNTSINSVFLTLWPDGSVIEGVANRTSVTDSVGSQYAYKSNAFAAWLYNSSPDSSFLIANMTGKPDYLLVRQAWMVETGGIFTESGINVSGANFGYNPFTSLNERVNKTTQLYQFFGSGLEEDTVITNGTAGTTIASYLKFSQGIQPFEYVDFYNVLTGNWSVVRQTAFNVTNNQTFLITYSPIPAPNLYVNITAAYMLGTQLAASNMVKFLFHCNAQACLWNNNAASLQLVYINQDTKIFKITYNESNATVAAANYPRK